MIENRSKVPILLEQIELTCKKRAEQAEVKKAVPELRQRVGNIIREHMQLPSKIGGKKIVLERPKYGDPSIDWIREYPDNNLSHERLSSTKLECRTVLPNGESITFMLSSSRYPFEKQAELDSNKLEPRLVNFTITSSKLSCYFRLDSRNNEGEICFMERERHHDRARPFTIDQVMLLKEILDLIESPPTTFYPHPYEIE